MRELEVLGNGQLKLNFSECKEFLTQDLTAIVRWQLQCLIGEALLAERDRYLPLAFYDHAQLNQGLQREPPLTASWPHKKRKPRHPERIRRGCTKDLNYSNPRRAP
jgi:hypothetical protein